MLQMIIQYGDENGQTAVAWRGPVCTPDELINEAIDQMERDPGSKYAVAPMLQLCEMNKYIPHIA